MAAELSVNQIQTRPESDQDWCKIHNTHISASDLTIKYSGDFKESPLHHLVISSTKLSILFY